MYREFFKFFSSAAKMSVIRACFSSKRALHLREIAYYCDLNIRSVQLAVDQLSREKLLLKRKEKNKLFILANREHQMSAFMEELIGVFSKHYIAIRGIIHRHDQKASYFLEANDSLIEMMEFARKSQDL